MSRFTPNPNRPDHLVASIVALAEQSNRLALDAAMEAARADARGDTAEVVDQVCRLAVGAGVAAGEIAWLVGELETRRPTTRSSPRPASPSPAWRAACAPSRTPSRSVADRGAPIEITSSAEALRRVARAARRAAAAPSACV